MSDKLFNLLPAIYRLRDAEQGSPMRALLAIAGQQLDAIDADIQGLYENWFIETCADWVVPYIGDLIGAKSVYAVTAGTSQRAYVAHTLGYRRRKGTAAMLEQLAKDVTGWPARAVEFFPLLATTQNINHVRPGALATVSLRDANALELLGGPFETSPHLLEVRHVDNGRGKYNIPNIALYLWRLQSYAVTRSNPRSAGGGAPPQTYLFHPLGFDAPLFNQPETQVDATRLASEFNVPGPLRRRFLYSQGLGNPPVIQIWLDGAMIPANQIAICDLTDWHNPSAGASIDPVLGRLALPSATTAKQVEVSYSYGFSGDIGGGPYDRSAALAASLLPAPSWQAQVTDAAGLTSALTDWSHQPAGATGIITIQNSHTYLGDLQITMPAGGQLSLIAANTERPHIQGKITLSGKGSLYLSGLLSEGVLQIPTAELTSLRIEDSTLAAGVQAGSGTGEMNINFARAISGPLALGPDTPSVAVTDSIAGPITAPDAAANIQSSTILGAVTVRSIEGGDSIFDDTLSVTERQVGCLRFCYFPPGSRTPRAYRCQPNLALAGVTDLAQQRAIAIRLAPQFTSRDPALPEFAQLGAMCAVEIRTGAEDGSEMGAFRFLKQPQREANLRASLDEYLRFGLEAGFFYAG